MKERKYYEEKYKMLNETEMFTEKDKVFMETTSNTTIETPNFDILIKRREKEPFISNDENTFKMHEKLVQKFSMHHYDPIISGNIDSTDFELHDKSTNRSSTNELKDKNVSNAYANNTIFVSKLPDSIKNSELEGFFSKYGEIERITIPKNIGSGVNKGYAFIEFKFLEDAVIAYEKSHKTILFGREILVDFVRGKNIEGWVPRRFGDAKGGQRFSGGRDVPHRNEKRDRYSRDYEDDRDDYDDHRHKRYRDYDRKMKRNDRKYYDRRDYDSYHDYDKKYYSDPYYTNERYEDYERYDRGYYEPLDERSSSQYHDDRRYFSEKRYYQDRRYDDYRYEENRGDRYYDYPYDDKRFPEYGEDLPPHYSSDKGYPSSSHYHNHHSNGYGDLDHNGLVPLHDQDKHHYNYPPSSSSYDDSHYNPSESNSLSSFTSSSSLSTSNNSLSSSTIVSNDKFYNQEAKLQN